MTAVEHEAANMLVFLLILLALLLMFALAASGRTKTGGQMQMVGSRR